MVGAIYLAKIYFTDLSEYKIRPVIIIKEIGEDCICLALTSNLNQAGTTITPNDLATGNLKKDSMVVYPKSFTLHRSILIKHLATVSSEKKQEIFIAFCHQIGCVNT